jgi:hypothetical protein
MTRAASPNLGLTMAAVLSLAACANLDTEREAPREAGQVHEFAAPYDDVAAATLASIDTIANITGTSEDASGLTILLSKPMSGMMNWGRVGRITVYREPTATTKVAVSWDKRVGLKDGGELEIGTTIFARVDTALAEAAQRTWPDGDPRKKGVVDKVDTVVLGGQEGMGKRVAYGWGVFGIVGALAAAGSTESDYGTVTLRQYEVHLASGEEAVLRSHAVVSVGDCVIVTVEGPGNMDALLRRPAAECGK